MRTIQLSERSREKMLHIEAPGCIINIQIGLTRANEDGSQMQITRIDVLPDADRYTGDPQWWARGSVKPEGAVVLVEQRDKADAPAE